MLLVLVLLFIVAPIVELYVIIQVAEVIGGWETIGLLLVESFLGAWLMKRQGLGVMRRVQAQLERSQLPAKELVDGFLILLAGALMLAPGFITDIIGFILLIPPTRALVRAVIIRRFTHRLGSGYGWMRPGAGPTFVGRVYDTRGRERRPPEVGE